MWYVVDASDNSVQLLSWLVIVVNHQMQTRCCLSLELERSTKNWTGLIQ